jgi:hypothetical protein
MLLTPCNAHDSSVHPRWLVKFGGHHKDEELYEHTFVKVLDAAELDSSGVENAKSQAVTAKPKSNKGRKRTVDSLVEDTSASEKVVDTLVEATNKDPPSSPNDNSSLHSEESSTQENDAKVSAREERSRRRQAAIDEFGMPTDQYILPPKRQKIIKKFGKRPREQDEQCLKIKLLTGTLYLYRGRHRRAEFIRKF